MTLIVVDLLLDGPIELAFVGARARTWPRCGGEVARRYLPNRIVSHRDPGIGDARRPAPARGQDAGERPRRPLRLPRLRLPAAGGRSRPTSRPRSPPPAPKDPATSAAPRPGARCPAAPTAGRHRALRGPAARGRRPGYAPAGRHGPRCAAGWASAATAWTTTPQVHREALAHALRSGCNVVDTSTNYTDGGSERLIGAVLADRHEGGRAAPRRGRSSSPRPATSRAQTWSSREAREEAGDPFPDMVKYADGVWHCIHPEFLRDQLARSRERLQVETLDVCLLHNPEYYLTDAHERSHGTLEKRRQEFDRRIRGRVRVPRGRGGGGPHRGATASRPTPACARRRTPSSPRSRACSSWRAKAGGADHHFRVLQLPMNLFEAGRGPRAQQRARRRRAPCSSTRRRTAWRCSPTGR